MPVQPLFIDLETRSAADLPKVGGWNYAKHPSTKILTAAWTLDGQEYHLWFPTIHPTRSRFRRPPEPELIQTHLDGIVLHYGPDVPQALIDMKERQWVAHNAWSFDQLVWEQVIGEECQPHGWWDTYPLAMAAGLPGKLDSIGARLWGEGKYEAGNHQTMKWTRPVNDSVDPKDVPLGSLVLIGRYNVQDVRLLYWLWEELQRTLHIDGDEKKVLTAHRDINNRGSGMDRGLLKALSHLSVECQARATGEIKRLTNGELDGKHHLRSRNKIFSWLGSIGVDVGTSLRKQIINRMIDEYNYKNDEDTEPGEHDPFETVDDSGTGKGNWALAFKVLELRQAALRITDAKIKAALEALDPQGVLRGLLAYWAAHTGRWGGRKFQPQNLPLPKPGVRTWDLIELYLQKGALPYDEVRAMLPIGDPNPLYRHLTVDDASAALLRGVVIPLPGDDLLAAADFANIEARVLAWLAGEGWLIEAFWQGVDPYIAIAETIYGPKTGWPPVLDANGKPLPIKKHPYRQVGKVVELGCGYQLGVDHFAAYAAGQGIDLEAAGTTARACIMAYRKMHPKIAGTIAGEYNGVPYFRGGFWGDLQTAMLRTVETREPMRVGRIRYSMEGPHLICTLPSNRRLVYRDARVESWFLEKLQKEVDAVTYTSPRFGRTHTYGGKAAENVVQGVSRDFLANALVRLEERNLPVVIHVHDEPVSSMKGGSRFPQFMEAVTTLPPWAPDFPLDAEGGLLPRYSKSAPVDDEDNTLPRYASLIPSAKEEVWRNGQRK